MQPSPKPLTPGPFSQKLIVLEIHARGLVSPGWTLNNHKSQHTLPYLGTLTRGQPHHGTRELTVGHVGSSGHGLGLV